MAFGAIGFGSTAPIGTVTATRFVKRPGRGARSTRSGDVVFDNNYNWVTIPGPGSGWDWGWGDDWIPPNRPHDKCNHCDLCAEEGGPDCWLDFCDRKEVSIWDRNTCRAFAAGGSAESKRDWCRRALGCRFGNPPH